MGPLNKCRENISVAITKLYYAQCFDCIISLKNSHSNHLKWVLYVLPLTDENLKLGKETCMFKVLTW